MPIGAAQGPWEVEPVGLPTTQRIPLSTPQLPWTGMAKSILPPMHRAGGEEGSPLWCVRLPHVVFRTGAAKVVAALEMILFISPTRFGIY